MKKKSINPSDLPYCLDAEDIAALLGISRSASYQLMHHSDFPLIRIGSRMLVRTDRFLKWVDAHTENVKTQKE